MTTETPTSFTAPYGGLEGVTFRELASNAKMDGGFIDEAQLLSTPYGELVPQFEAEDMGRRTLKPLCFYKDGAPKSIPLQSQAVISTPVGPLPAELVTFYPSGALKRVFPLDGKLSGFWSWQNELKLAHELEFDSPSGPLRAKVIAFRFYESGALKSLTLWPGQALDIMTPVGIVTTRKGVAYHEDGSVRSVEPMKKTEVSTPIGTMRAYDNEPAGIHGDSNSLEFAADGTLQGLSTIDDAIETESGGIVRLFRPGLKNNVCGDERKVSVPMRVRFEGERIWIDGAAGMGIAAADCRLVPLKKERQGEEPAYSCSD
ncbi:hypothetical protein [Chlorobium sp. N1]|uniref:hypothetical protein n=1 Tax=Chlorobium sp. N1 TaxID=2491138 RepID=UPI00103EECB0|nr:hypothetical protein [Chlorobium sp. N1]TCD47444.1 hypothetical protein E0L29_07825 [Chlorobium sp. N1]